MTFEYLHPKADEVLDLLVEHSLAKVCVVAKGFPSKRTVLNWRRSDPAFCAAYEAALNSAAFAAEDDHRMVTERMLTGTIEPEVGRVVQQGLRWQAAKRAPQVFGDKIEHSGSLTLEQLVAGTGKTGEG